MATPECITKQITRSNELYALSTRLLVGSNLKSSSKKQQELYIKPAINISQLTEENEFLKEKIRELEEERLHFAFTQQAPIVQSKSKKSEELLKIKQLQNKLISQEQLREKTNISLRKQYNEIKNSLEKEKNTIGELNIEVESLRNSRDDLQQILNNEREKSKQEIKTLNTQFFNCEETIKKIAKEHQILKKHSQSEIEKKDNLLNKKENENKDLTKINENLERKLIKNKTSIKQKDAKIISLEETTKNCGIDITNLQDELNLCKKRSETSQFQIKQKNDIIEIYKSNLEQSIDSIQYSFGAIYNIYDDLNKRTGITEENQVQQQISTILEAGIEFSQTAQLIRLITVYFIDIIGIIFTLSLEALTKKTGK